MIIIFFGPPGAGKGTQASLTAKKLNIPHLSTGDILRDKLLDQDSLSSKLKNPMDSGNLVSDDILNEIVANRLKLPDCQGGFILDGYPRTMSQKIFLIDFLESHDLSISKIINLSIDEKIIIERIKSRSNIENRLDDREEIIKTRMIKYLKATKPLFKYFRSKYPNDYHIVDGNQNIENIQDDILKIVKNKDFQP
jgi:adenylate kinase